MPQKSQYGGTILSAQRSQHSAMASPKPPQADAKCGGGGGEVGVALLLMAVMVVVVVVVVMLLLMVWLLMLLLLAAAADVGVAVVCQGSSFHQFGFSPFP